MPTPARTLKPPDPHACPWCQNKTHHPPKIHVHIPPRPDRDVDPILGRSLLALTVALGLLTLGILLDPVLAVLDRTRH